MFRKNIWTNLILQKMRMANMEAQWSSFFFYLLYGKTTLVSNEKSVVRNGIAIFFLEVGRSHTKIIFN